MTQARYVLLTGGAGYIGSHINQLLDQMGYRTLVYDNLVNGHRDFVRWGHFIEGDLFDTEKLKTLFLHLRHLRCPGKSAGGRGPPSKPHQSIWGQ